MIMKILQIAVFLILAVPFVYMAYDIVIDISQRIYNSYRLKARPVLISVINMLFK